jgi:hypothetical protein
MEHKIQRDTHTEDRDSKRHCESESTRRPKVAAQRLARSTERHILGMLNLSGVIRLDQPQRLRS